MKELEGLFRVGRFYYDSLVTGPRHVRRLGEISTFYTNERVLDLLIPIVTQSYDISLRVLDFFCTNWTKLHRVVSVVTVSGRQETVNIFSLYKDALRHWRRKLFDPFRRRERIYFRHPETDELLATTCAQLNFLKWAETYGVLDRIREQLPQIESDMLQCLGASRKRRLEESDSEQKRRRAELTPSSPMKCHVYMVRQMIEFDRPS